MGVDALRIAATVGKHFHLHQRAAKTLVVLIHEEKVLQLDPPIAIKARGAADTARHGQSGDRLNTVKNGTGVVARSLCNCRGVLGGCRPRCILCHLTKHSRGECADIGLCLCHNSALVRQNVACNLGHISNQIAAQVSCKHLRDWHRDTDIAGQDTKCPLVLVRVVGTKVQITVTIIRVKDYFGTDNRTAGDAGSVKLDHTKPRKVHTIYTMGRVIKVFSAICRLRMVGYLDRSTVDDCPITDCRGDKIRDTPSTYVYVGACARVQTCPPNRDIHTAYNVLDRVKLCNIHIIANILQAPGQALHNTIFDSDTKDICHAGLILQYIQQVGILSRRKSVVSNGGTCRAGNAVDDTHNIGTTIQVRHPRGRFAGHCKITSGLAGVHTIFNRADVGACTTGDIFGTILYIRLVCGKHITRQIHPPKIIWFHFKVSDPVITLVPGDIGIIVSNKWIFVSRSDCQHGSQHAHPPAGGGLKSSVPARFYGLGGGVDFLFKSVKIYFKSHAFTAFLVKQKYTTIFGIVVSPLDILMNIVSLKTVRGVHRRCGRPHILVADCRRLIIKHNAKNVGQFNGGFARIVVDGVGRFIARDSCRNGLEIAHIGVDLLGRLDVLPESNFVKFDIFQKFVGKQTGADNSFNSVPERRKHITLEVFAGGVPLNGDSHCGSALSGNRFQRGDVIQDSSFTHLPDNNVHLICQIFRKLSESGLVGKQLVTGQCGAVLCVVLGQQMSNHFRAGNACRRHGGILIICLRTANQVNKGCTAVLLMILFKLVVPLRQNAGNETLKLRTGGESSVPLIFEDRDIVVDMIKTIIGGLNGLGLANLIGTIFFPVLDIAGQITFGNVTINICNLTHHIAILFFGFDKAPKLSSVRPHPDIGTGQHLRQGVSHGLIANALCHGGDRHKVTGCKLGNYFLSCRLFKGGVQNPSSLINAHSKVACINRHYYVPPYFLDSPFAIHCSASSSSIGLGAGVSTPRRMF
nr:MAG TPA: hypothetical protein [Caudoviricetes sp.]